MTYEEGCAVRLKWSRGAVAEYAGFVDASFPPSIRLKKFATPYEDQRYEQGLADGLAMKAQDEMRKAAAERVSA